MKTIQAINTFNLKLLFRTINHEKSAVRFFQANGIVPQEMAWSKGHSMELYYKGCKMDMQHWKL